MEIYTSYISTPLGELYVACNDKNIIYLHFYEEKRIIRDFPYYISSKKTSIQFKKTKLIENLEFQLNKYFNKEYTPFDIPTEYFGTNFQKQVWSSLDLIPIGKTASYSEFSSIIKHPNKARAVAYAISRNPILIINPCHRIIGSNKNLTGYSGGLWRKESLLILEKNIHKNISS